MTSFKNDSESQLTRRDFLRSTTMAAGLCLIGCSTAPAQSPNVPISNGLEDPAVIHGQVTFPSGDEVIDGYLAHPKAKGKYPAVLVIAGNKISDAYIRNTTAMLAQNGFVGLAPNIFTLQNDSMSADEKRSVFVNKITDERIFRDIQAGIDYLRKQSFVVRRPMGVMGFCFGGRCALMLAARSKEIGAVVPYYGNLKTPAFAKRAIDPVDVVKQIKAPTQGHYAKDDQEIPADQLQKFADQLRAQKTPVEIFTYEAKHGFFAYDRSSYDADAARLAWTRTTAFLKRFLK
jgi:carboxymethylenebutenolidase